MFICNFLTDTVCMKLNENDREFFNQNGYIVIDKVFRKKDINKFKLALDYLIEQTLHRVRPYDKEFFFDICLKELVNINPLYISYIQRVMSRTPEFLRLSSNENIAILIKYLLGISSNSPLYITSNGVVFTSPKAIKNNLTNFEIDWHLDTFYTIPKSRFIQIWAPLYHDADSKIGTLTLCPGSNKIEPCLVKQKYDPSLPYNNQYYVDPLEIMKYKPTSIDVKLGQLLIFDGRTIHSSGINLSKHFRCTLLGLYHDTRLDEFNPLTIHYKYEKLTPEEYFYQTYNDTNAKNHAYDHAVEKELAGGV